MGKVAIMQPYFMPYIGYFQLVNAVDKFVFYDDVNYIKSGWINRNRILINGEAKYINVPQKGASSFKLINQVEANIYCKDYTKILKTIEASYKNAPFFYEVFGLVKKLLDKEYTNIAQIAIESVIIFSTYLDIKTDFSVSSKDFMDTKGLEKSTRLISICKKLNSETYVNPIGGSELYSKEEFKKAGINLLFINSKPIEYRQFNNEFVPWLSILDVLMFNAIPRVKEMLNEYELL